MLARKAEINALDDDHAEPLRQAVVGGNTELVKVRGVPGAFRPDAKSCVTKAIGVI